VRLKRKDRLVVAVPSEPPSTLTAEAVERTREELLEERAAND
jgi:hypothetical protein